MHLVVGCTRTRERAISDLERLISETARFKRLFQRLAHHSPSGGRDRSANWLLFAVRHHGPVRLADLASACYIDASTASRQVADLVTRGLLERRADPADGRASLLALTDDGERAVQVMIRAREEFFTGALADWDDDDVRRLADLLSRLTDDLLDQAERRAPDHDHPSNRRSLDRRKAAR
jgi:DNA-binding MarR family transcriptional regulator